MADGSSTLKTCTKCGLSKPTAEFYQTKGRLLSECKVCWRARVKARNEAHPPKPRPPEEGQAWRQAHPEVVKARKKALTERNRKIIHDIRATTPCADCGRVLPPWTMQFDHLPERDKKFNVTTKAKTYTTRKMLLTEIAKCEIVCGVCHAHRTYCRVNGIEPYTLTLLPQRAQDV